MTTIWKVLTAPFIFLFYCTFIHTKLDTFSDIDFMSHANNSILLVVEDNDRIFKEYKNDIIKSLTKKGFKVYLDSNEAYGPIDIIAKFDLKNRSKSYTYETNRYDFVPNGDLVTSVSPDYRTTTVEAKQKLAVVGKDTHYGIHRRHSFLLTFYNAHTSNPEVVFSLNLQTTYASDKSISNKFIYKFLIAEGISRMNPVKSEEYNFTVSFPLGIDEKQY
jgi:hypothetical protein